MTKTQKISVSLPTDLVSKLDYLAGRLGVSRSALMAEVLGESITRAADLVQLIPPNPTPADVLRMRGESEDLVRQRVAQLQGIANDLLSK